MIYRLVGRAKVFLGEGANVHSIVWGKTLVHKGIQVIYLIFNAAPRASKSGCRKPERATKTAQLRSPTGTIKNQVNDLKSFLHSRFTPKN